LRPWRLKPFCVADAVVGVPAVWGCFWASGPFIVTGAVVGVLAGWDCFWASQHEAGLQSLPAGVAVAVDGMLAVSLIVFLFCLFAAFKRSQVYLTQETCQPNLRIGVEYKALFCSAMQRMETMAFRLR